MGSSKAIARVLGQDQLECVIETQFGDRLVLTGETSDLEPEVAGDNADLASNRALIHNAWAYAKFTHLKVHLPTHEEQKRAEKQAQGYRAVAEWIATVAGNLTREQRTDWCSGCLGHHDHRKSARPSRQLPVWICTFCGTPTLPCASPKCENMAVRGRGAVTVPRYCAEHRHDIPSFETASEKFGPLENYTTFLEFEQPNLAKATKVAGAALAVVPLAAGLATFAAPAIGGAIGTQIGGFSGAAAANYGLALLGGGAIADGGFGMVGGTFVIGALGGALGAGLGGSVTHAYVREDKSFRIEKLRGGTGIPVIVCNGFLSESGHGWDEWKSLVDRRYPDSPVYRVHWGAKELKHLGIGFVGAAGKAVVSNSLRKAAAIAAKTNFKVLGPLAPMLVAAQVAKNPWHVAKNRAEKTGLVVADLIERTDAESYVLIGHSLGARAMVVALQALSSTGNPAKVKEAHLLGAAIGANSDWQTMSTGVENSVFNYHSANDNILKVLYKVAQVGESAAGLTGFTPDTAHVTNVDVGSDVDNHSAYFHKVELR